MKRFKINVIAGAVFLMSLQNLAGCSHPATAPVDSSGAATGSRTTKTSAVVIVIDENGLTMTKEDGTPQTSVVTDLTTSIVTVTGSNGEVVTQANGKPVTSVVTSPTVPTTTTMSKTTGKTNPVNTTTATAYTTTTRKPTTTTTTTTKKPSTTTTKKPTTTTKKPTTTTTTKKSSGNPWEYPYDLNQIYKDAKAYALSIGFEWDDTLTKDNSHWITPNSTVPWTLGEMSMSFKSKTLEEIGEYKEMGFEVLNLYMEPDTEDIGDYWVYYLLG